jgi:hypothetical protein
MRDTSTAQKQWLVLAISRPVLRPWKQQEYLRFLTRVKELQRKHGSKMGIASWPGGFSVQTQDVELYWLVRTGARLCRLHHFTRDTSRKLTNTGFMWWVKQLWTSHRSGNVGR